MSKCSICGETVSRWAPVRFHKDSHYQTVHPDLVSWYNHFQKILWATGLAVIGIILAAFVSWLEVSVGLPPLYIFPVFELWAAIVLIDFQLNYRRFKKSWKAAHPLQVEQFTVS